MEVHGVLYVVSIGTIYLCLPFSCATSERSDVLPVQDQESVAYFGYRNLTHVPNSFSADTSWIDLSHNKILELNIAQNLPKLLYLDMSYNRVSTLCSNSFRLIPNLEELRLNDNYLNLSNKAYPKDVFMHLKRLVLLHLHNNDLNNAGIYPEKAFQQLSRLEELRIDTFERTSFGPGFGNMKDVKQLLLGFHGCKLTELTNDTFQHFAGVNIEVLNLDYCPIFQVEANTFWYLKRLKYLYMSHCNLMPKIALISMYGLRGRNVSVIHFDNLMTRSVLRKTHFDNFVLSLDVLRYIKDVCVFKFSIKHNEILWFQSGWLNSSVFASCIEYLDLSDNDLYGDDLLLFQSSFLPNLKYVDISRYSTKGRFAHVREPQTLPKENVLGFTLPSGLQYLNLNGFSVNVLQMGNVDFYDASSLREFSFAFNKVDRFGRMRGLENISSLDLSGNSCGNMPPAFFDDFRCLSKLNMSGSALNQPENYLRENGSRLMKNLKKLETFVISNNDLTFLNTKMFLTNPLKVINLSYNRFLSIPFDLETTVFLHHLDLSFNSITSLENSDIDKLNILAVRNNFTLDLTGNLLFCGCENLNLVLWLYKTEVHLPNLEDYPCITENGSMSNISHAYQNFDKVWKECVGTLWFFITSTCFVINILAIVCAYILSQRKTLILNILLRLFRLETVIKQPSREDFLYDAYLGYSEFDYLYIYETVSKYLETKHKTTVFIGDRDMIPGRSIPQEIVTAVDSSWRVVLILTHAFLKDNWCRFITDYAVYVSTFRPTGCVLLVLFDDVDKAELPPSVLNVVEERHIFNVLEYWQDEESMWKAISNAIKSN